MAVFIFHGVGGSAEENWFPWLKTELEARGQHVIAPSFPSANTPDYNAWKEHFSGYRELLTEDSILIGHSLGAAFALRVLEDLPHAVRSCFLVAAVHGTMQNQFDPLMTTFTEGEFDWELLKTKAQEYYILHADNDPFIALPLAEELARNLDTPLTLIPSGGHLNAAAGYNEFPLLLGMLMMT